MVTCLAVTPARLGTSPDPSSAPASPSSSLFSPILLSTIGLEQMTSTWSERETSSPWEAVVLLAATVSGSTRNSPQVQAKFARLSSIEDSPSTKSSNAHHWRSTISSRSKTHSNPPFPPSPWLHFNTAEDGRQRPCKCTFSALFYPSS